MAEYDHNATQHAGATSELIPALVRFLRIVNRRRQVVGYSLAISLAAGLTYYALAPRQYASAARLLVVEPTQGQVATVGEASDSDNTINTHRELVASPVVLEGALGRLAPAYRVDLVERPPHEWVEELSRRLETSTKRRTNFIDVSYRSRHPVAAAAVVRAVIESYLDFVRKTHQSAAGELKTVLTDERAKLAQSLAQKQNELQAFRQSVGALALPEEEGVVDPVVQRALHLNDSLMAAHERRIELQAAAAAIDVAAARGEDINRHLAGIEQSVGEQAMLMSLGMSAHDMTVLAEQENKLLESQDELQKLAPFYGPNHPRVGELQQQIASLETYLTEYRARAGRRGAGAPSAEVTAVVKTMLAQSIRQAQEREQQLSAAFEAARRTASDHSGQIVELAMLEREVERIESLHGLLFERIANVDFRQVQAPVQATVVREPLPPRRAASPQLRMVLLTAIAAGLALGAGIVYVQDVLDDRFDSPEELSAQLAAPVLAIVRELDSLNGDGLAGVHVHATPHTAATEAFRTLRTALSLQAAASKRLLVSSSEAGDGKTTIVVNLAAAFAQSGKRTLMIDADLRKPGLSTRLALKQRAGVAEVLASEAPIGEIAAELVYRLDAPGLDVLPCGARRPDPAELLGSARFAELLAWAESQYDQVIVDCPPVLAVSDAQVVGRVVDGAVLVVRPEKNHRRLVMRAAEAFRSTGCEVLGVVANGISDTSGGYGYGYGYGYGAGDGHDESHTSASVPFVAGAEPDEAPTPELIRPRRAA
jgi:succinoglycan biosynthesis transport protein ExoP